MFISYAHSDVIKSFALRMSTYAFIINSVDAHLLWLILVYFSKICLSKAETV